MTANSLPFSSPMASTLLHTYEICTYFADQHKQTAVSLTESLFYKLAVPVSARTEELRQSIHRLAYNHFHNFQKIFLPVNAVLSLYSLSQIFDSLGYSSIKATSMGSAVIILISAGVFALYKVQHERSGQRLIKSNVQILSGIVQMTGIVQSLALSFLTDQKISHLVRGAMQAYSLYKNFQCNWISVADTYNFEVDPRHSLKIKQVDASYSAFLLTRSNSHDSCGICLEKNPDQIFCSNSHTYHTPCLDGYLNSVRDRLPNVNEYVRRDTANYRNGVYTGTTYSYRVKVPETNLPDCPTCRERPSHNYYKITVHDQDKGVFNAAIDIQRVNPPKSSQVVFEKVYAIYNAFQGILGGLQQIPEFTGSITVLRRIMFVSEIAMGIIANHYLLKNLKERNKSWAVAIIPAVFATIPIFIGLESFFNSKDNVSRMNTNNTIVNWQRPLVERIQGAFNAYRFATTFALTYFSKANKVYNLTSLLGQAVGLLGAINVRWLCVTQSKLGPMNIEFNTYAIISEAMVKSENAMKNAVNYIVNLQKEIVNKGSVTVTNHYKNNVLTEKTLSIFYTMKKIDDLREYLLKPFIWTFDGLKGSGVYEYGYRSLSICLT